MNKLCPCANVTLGVLQNLPGAEQRLGCSSVCPGGLLSPSPVCRRKNLPRAGVFQVKAEFLWTALCKGGSKPGQEFSDSPFPHCQMSTPTVGLPGVRHCQKTANPSGIHLSGAALTFTLLRTIFLSHLILQLLNFNFLCAGSAFPNFSVTSAVGFPFSSVSRTTSALREAEEPFGWQEVVPDQRDCHLPVPARLPAPRPWGDAFGRVLDSHVLA